MVEPFTPYGDKEIKELDRKAKIKETEGRDERKRLRKMTTCYDVLNEQHEQLKEEHDKLKLRHERTCKDYDYLQESIKVFNKEFRAMYPILHPVEAWDRSFKHEETGKECNQK